MIVVLSRWWMIHMATNTQELAKALRRGLREVKDELPDAAEPMLRDFKTVVSTPFPPQSAPGSEPHLRTGGYRAGLAVRTAGNVITFFARGFSNNLAIWLEFGTRKMAPRVHWRKHLPRIAAEHLPKKIGAALVRGESGG